MLEVQEVWRDRLTCAISLMYKFKSTWAYERTYSTHDTWTTRKNGKTSRTKIPENVARKLTLSSQEECIYFLIFINLIFRSIHFLILSVFLLYCYHSKKPVA